MSETFRSPAQLRSMFGANLRLLARSYPSVSELCRQLGINRTQFNRYLSGESFPRPDVLDRICRFFDVDARILLAPLHEIETKTPHPFTEAWDGFLGTQPPTALTPGFYHAQETDTGDLSDPFHSLLFIRRIGHCTLLRSYVPRAHKPGHPAAAREFQGIVSQSGPRIYILMSRKDAQDCRIMTLSPASSETDAHWSGHILNLSEGSSPPPGMRSIDLRHLGPDVPAILRAGRLARQTAPQMRHTNDRELQKC